ncbi:MAG: hypothetical protein HQK64_13970, partial [Desulfamplus sp.]|nr:hypothetical protein [Desulfamplus sp.]
MTKRILIMAIALLTLASVAHATNYALNFDGTDDYVRIEDNDQLDFTESTTTYTIEAWIKPKAFISLGGIVSKYNSDSSYGYVLRLSDASPYSGIHFDKMKTAEGIL